MSPHRPSMPHILSPSAAATGKGIEAGGCGIIDDMLEPLDPLPRQDIPAMTGKAPFRLRGSEKGE
ncbi:MAG: hypothetical protein QM690_17160 [Sphingobium sp.]